MKNISTYRNWLFAFLFAITMIMPQSVWAATHYDAGYASAEINYNKKDDGGYMYLKLGTMRIWNYQGNGNTHFYSNPKVVVTVEGVGTHTLYLNSLYTISAEGSGDEKPFKTSNDGNGNFRNSETYDATQNNVRVAAYFANHTFETTVSGSNNGGGSSKWCTADLYIHVYTFKKTTISITGSWRDWSDGVNTNNENVSWSFSGGFPRCSSVTAERSGKDAKISWTASAADSNGSYDVWRCDSSGSIIVYTTNSSGSSTSYSYTDTDRCGGGYNYCVTYRPAGWEQGYSPIDFRDLWEFASSLDLSHDYTNQKTYNKSVATCTDDAVYYKACQYCSLKSSTTWTDTGSSLGHGTTGYTDNISWSDADTYDAPTCTFSLTCKKCSKVVVDKESLALTLEVNQLPLCEVNGLKKYSAIGTYTPKNTTYKFDKYTSNSYIVPALGHNYGEEGEWSWTDNGQSASCTRTCTRDNSHTSKKDVSLNSGITSAEQVPAQCTQMGTTRYSATATVEGKEYGDTKDVVDIAKLDHQMTEHARVDPKCLETGTELYYTCSRTCCSGVNYKEDAAHTESAWDDIVIAALGHSFTDYVYNNNVTCAAQGTKTANCGYNCGATDTQTDEEHALLPHTLEHFICKNCNAQPAQVAAGTLEWGKDYKRTSDCTVADLTFTRDFADADWQTWYEPFELTLTSANSEGYEFARINNVHQYEDENGNIDQTVVECFRITGKLHANYPYIVKKVNGQGTMTINTENAALQSATDSSIVCESMDYTYTFTGNYQDKSISSIFALDGGDWTAATQASAQTHYLTITPRADGYSSHQAAPARVLLQIIGEEDATGIVTLYTETKRQAETYTLSGQRLAPGAKGLQIRNGKTRFVK